MAWAALWGTAFLWASCCAAPAMLLATALVPGPSELEVVTEPNPALKPIPIAGLLDNEEKEAVVVVDVEEIEKGVEEKEETEACCWTRRA